MSQLVNYANDSLSRGINSFCKFISANDAGKTGGHQEGFYMPKSVISLMFDKPGEKGQNLDRFIKIKWQNDFETQSRFIYYGKGTRNEYRLTRFGRGFPFLTENNVGDLFILVNIGDDYYEGFVLQSDEDIEDFFASNSLSANDTNKLIKKNQRISTEDLLGQCFEKYVYSMEVFPSTIELAAKARSCYLNAFQVKTKSIISFPDQHLLGWLNAEFQLFKTFENKIYSSSIYNSFKNIDELIEFANSILNRRKSRAGKSLEHHLAEVFNCFHISFESQVITEDYKKPDFIFPNSESYHNSKFPENKLALLASKTTCKDRWRQVLNEADRIKQKHLFTLQQGISKNQLDEMYKYGIKLVVPKPYINTFPIEYRNSILSLELFVEFISEMQREKY